MKDRASISASPPKRPTSWTISATIASLDPVQFASPVKMDSRLELDNPAPCNIGIYRRDDFHPTPLASSLIPIVTRRNC